MTIDMPKLSDIPALRVLWQDAFGDSDDFLDSFFATAFDMKRARCVKEDGKIVAVLYWFDCAYNGERIAYVYAVTTAKACRGRGVCSALMDDVHRHMASLGYAGVVLVPCAEELFRFYERFGYSAFGGVSEFRCQASDEKTALREVDADEYAKLRRAFLPKDSVLQENENIKFLQTQAKLYAGDGFLLVASREKDTLYGVELLGDTAKAPSIVRALGCANGRFRTVGAEKPFAMYRNLGDKPLSPPAYFGLAFD